VRKKILMTSDWRAREPFGHNGMNYRKGEEYEVPEDIYNLALKAKVAKDPTMEVKAKKAAPSNKAKGKAPEDKSKSKSKK
jgi:hypothetical protein